MPYSCLLFVVCCLSVGSCAEFAVRRGEVGRGSFGLGLSKIRNLGPVVFLFLSCLALFLCFP
jgi:hypothetical protein